MAVQFFCRGARREYPFTFKIWHKAETIGPIAVIETWNANFTAFMFKNGIKGHFDIGIASGRSGKGCFKNTPFFHGCTRHAFSPQNSPNAR